MDYETTSLKGVYTLFKPQEGSSSILFDSPHSGTYFPNDFNYTCDKTDINRLADLYVDELFEDTPQHGHTFLRAETSRAYIDLNRDTNDIDLELLNDIWPYPISTKGRAKYGVGLIYKNAYNGTPIYKKPLSAEQVKARITKFYMPYHEILTSQLDTLAKTHKEILHINCHSFPSKQGINELPDFVLGDRNGTTCLPHITNQLKQIIETYGYSVNINHPYKGSTLIQKTGDIIQNRFSIQIEINRRLYMNEQKLEKNINFNELKENINSISQRIKTLFFRNDLAAD